MCGWQVKLCDPLVTHSPYLSALAVVLPIIRRYTNNQINLTLTSGHIQHGRRRPKFRFLNRYNSAADCSTSHKFGIHSLITADTLQMFKVTASEVKVTA